MARFVMRTVTAALVMAAFSWTSSAHPQSQPGPPAVQRGPYTLVLVDTDSPAKLAEASDFIVSRGGEAAIIVPPHAIMGWIRPELDPSILGQHGIRAIHRSPVDSVPSRFRDRETRLAISAFNDAVSGSNAQKRLRESRQPTGPRSARPGMLDCSLPRPAMDRNDVIRNLRLLGAEQSIEGIQSVTPQYFSNSDVMDGTVAVAVFFVESAGGVDPNVYSWTQADQDQAFSQIVDGLNWWVEQSRAFNLARPLQFKIIPFSSTNPACQIPYEPVLRSGSDAVLWINQIMSNLGATAGNVFERVAAFDGAIRTQNRADWAYSMFIAYNPAPARTSFTDGRSSWAYLGGPFTVSLFHSFGWSLSRITSHETGHIFYACDEYFQVGYQTCSCSCVPEVRPSAVNGNCQDLACNRASTECMMRINESALCAFTVAQIGWTSAVPRPAPSAPGALVASSGSPTQVTLVWQDTSPFEDGFQIERRGGSSADYSQIGVVSSNTITYSDTTVLPNTAYGYRVRAFNGAGVSSYSNEATVITPSTPSVLTVGTSELPEGTVGVAYGRTLTAFGGEPEFTWMLETGSLPAGLSLNQSGVITGIPLTPGTSNFVARVTDSKNNTASKALTLIVKPAAPLTINTTQLPRGSVGSTYSQNLGATGGQTPYTWSIQSGNLPDGLTLNQSGVISGTPERAGTSSFVLGLTDAANTTVTATLSIIVNPSVLPLSIDTISLPDGVVGQEYSQTLKASGGNGPYRWQLKSGRLPDGLRLSDEGIISGTPTAPGEVQFEVTAADQSGQSISSALSIDVDPPPELTILSPASLPVAALGVPYRYEFKAAAGTAPYSWSKKKKKKFGTLPDGLTLSSEGILSGTPTVQNTFNFTVRVEDAIGRLASKPMTLEVGPPPPPLSIKTATLPQAPQGVNYTARLEASGGVGPYTWSIDSGALPDGLTLAADGLIAGRPTTLGSMSFVVRVRDSLGSASTRQLSLTVSLPPLPLVIQTVSLPETTAERPYSQLLQASGGIPPYSWSIASGSLASGLNLSADGLISGTPGSAGTSIFVVRVTDSALQSVTRTLAIIIKPSDKLAPFGALETPAFKSTLSNTVTGTGWALDNVGVVAVEVLVDGQKVGDALYGLSRPDVAVVWSNFPNAGQSGFTFQLDTTKFSVGDHTLAVRVLDAAGNSALIGARLVTIQNAVLSIATTVVPRGKKGEFYDFTFTAVSGSAPYSWALVSGSLPAGLSLNAAGRISGTPSVFGTFSFSVRVTDSVGASSSAAFSIVIIPDIEPLRIVSNGDLAGGSTGVEYSQQLFFAGGVGPPRTWSLSTGALPPGLSLGSSSGLISGTPTQIGTFSFTVQLTDATTTVTSGQLRITITPGPLIIQTSGSLSKGTVGVAYSFTLQGIGGAKPYTWTKASGTLPNGLSLNSSSGVISGTPTEAGTFTFTVKLADSQPVDVTSSTLTLVVDPAPP